MPSFAVYPGPSLPSIIVYTGTTTLPEIDEQGEGKPGWYLPVNWNDYDEDNWPRPGNTEIIPTADSGPVLSSDLFDEYIPGPSPNFTGGSPALFKFEVSANLVPIAEGKDGNVKLTFDTTKIKVWSTNTKKLDGANSSSSEIGSGSTFNWQCDMEPNGGKITLYAEGIAGSNSFKDAFLKAELTDVTNALPPGAPDEVQVTAFEVTTLGRYTGGKSSDNSWSFQTAPYASNELLGKIDYTQDALCRRFRNCMEMQGTVKPPVDQNQNLPYGFYPPGPLTPYIVKFGATRSAYGCEWGLRSSDNQWETATGSQGIAKPQYVWSNDDLGGGLDVDVSTSSHIYYSDSPGWASNSTTKSLLKNPS